jgi:hypothetical protein
VEGATELRTSRKAVVAIVVALLVMIPLAGSALAKPIVVDNLDAKMDAIQDAVDRVPRAADVETRHNHGWYVSQFSTDFDRIMGDARVGTEDLSRGRWISMFSRWLKRGSELEPALRAKAAKHAEIEERKQNRAEARVQGANQDDDDGDGLGRQNAPGQLKKAGVTASESASELNRGLAKKAERAAN